MAGSPIRGSTTRPVTVSACAPRIRLLDDVPANIDGARAVGMHAVLFTDTAQAIADLEALMS